MHFWYWALPLLSTVFVLAEDSRRDPKQLVAFVYTSTHTSLFITTTTSTVPRICIFGPNTLSTCAGRRRRKRSKNYNFNNSDGDWRLERAQYAAPQLEPSAVAIPRAGGGGGRTARFLALSFTSLVTLTSTTTSTTFSTNTATTVSVSILCTAAGMNLETFYCAGG